jgi:hypothetical protein
MPSSPYTFQNTATQCVLLKFSATVGTGYGDTLQQWQWPQLKDDFSGHLFFQPDGTLPNFHFAVRAFLDEELPRGWTDGAGPGTMAPRLVHLNFYFLVFITDHVYTQSPADLRTLLGTPR